MSDEDVEAMLRRAPGQDAPRDDHPDVDVLLQLARRTMNESERSVVEAHLVRCRECRDFAADLADSPPEQMVTRATEALTPRRSRRWVAVAVGAFAAAAAALFLLVPAQPDLVSYTLRGPFGGEARLRGPTDEGAIFRADNQFELVLAPARATRNDATMFALFIEGPDGTARRTAIDEYVEKTGEGAWHLEIPAAELFRHGAGIYTVHVLVSRSRLLPDTLDPTKAPNNETQHFKTRVRFMSEKE